MVTNVLYFSTSLSNRIKLTYIQLLMRLSSYYLLKGQFTIYECGQLLCFSHLFNGLDNGEYIRCYCAFSIQWALLILDVPEMEGDSDLTNRSIPALPTLSLPMASRGVVPTASHRAAPCEGCCMRADILICSETYEIRCRLLLVILPHIFTQLIHCHFTYLTLVLNHNHFRFGSYYIYLT